MTFAGQNGLVVNPSDDVTNAELSVSFKVKKSIDSTPNEFTVEIENLRETSRRAIGNELEEVKLEAGFINETGSNLAIIANGFIRDVVNVKDGPTWRTEITAGDGDAAIRQSTVSKTFPSGSSPRDVMTEVYENMKPYGVVQGEWKFPDGMKTYARPYSICGASAREADSLARSNGFLWSIQDGTLEVIPRNGYLSGAILISKSSGLIGAPSITDNGVKFESLLNPAIRPNRILKVESETLAMNSENSFFRAGEVEFSGNNRSGSFTVSVHAEAIFQKEVSTGALTNG